MRPCRAGAGLALALLAAPAEAQDAPLSAIDWLSESVASPAALPAPPRIAEPPVASGAGAPGITVTPLDRLEAGPVGVLGLEETGLPASLWAASEGAVLLELLRASPPETLPALQDLVVELMLAEATGPRDGDGAALALARVDRLLDMGALEAAEALLESGDLLDPEWFRRWFDVTLLRGTEDRACEILREHPALAPTLEARVFCLARNGDWNAAALTLGTARALGDVSPEDELLLARFLDPEIEPGTGAATDRPSPLVYRIREAVGDLMPTTGLPLAFAHADLRSTVAWRAQIEAAERLARRGALAPEALRDVYLARRPAASGGVWDRAAAVQALDAALLARDEAAAAEALLAAWSALDEAGLRSALARLYGPTLVDLDLAGPARAPALEAGLLSGAFAEAARRLDGSGPEDATFRAAALGEPAPEGVDARADAVLAGLGDAPVPEALAPLLRDGRVGEAALRAVAAFGQGLDGDRAAVTDAIATLRALGLGDVARRAALEYLILGDEA
jgi:hypothetical protein